MARSIDDNDKTEDDRAARKFCDGGGVLVKQKLLIF